MNRHGHAHCKQNTWTQAYFLLKFALMLPREREAPASTGTSAPFRARASLGSAERWTRSRLWSSILAVSRRSNDTAVYRNPERAFFLTRKASCCLINLRCFFPAFTLHLGGFRWRYRLKASASLLIRMISFPLGVLSFSFLENRSHREVEAESCGFRCL